MLMTTAVAVILVMVVMFVFLLLRQLLQGGSQGIATLHGGQQLFAVQFVPGGGYNSRGGVLFPQQRHTGIQLFLLHAGGTAEDDGTGVFHLVIEKLAEILHIHFSLGGIHHGGKAVQDDLLDAEILHGADDVAELSNTGRFDEDTVGVIGFQHLAQRLTEIADKAAADAAAVHFGNIDAGLLQKAAVNANLAEFIFDKDDLLAGIGLGDQLFDKGGFARPEKAGENINFSHSKHLFSMFY